jgi:23S rRNA pseudouridine2605 synthase/23S rRNA pseudouridine2604 synthase
MWERMKLQKYMWQAWICSRRKAEEYIKKGLVKVNWEEAHIGQVIDSGIDKIEMLDTIVQDQKSLVYYKLNKPRGIVTTCAEYWDKNIIDIVDIKERVFPIGRLDKETTGLILLTNDGRLTNYLIHPRYEHEKEYIVETFWPISDDALNIMRDWLCILGSKTKEAKIERLAAGKFSIILKEWKNRQIRRMVEKVDSRVKKLKRIRIENIEVWKLDYGQYRHLSNSELKELFSRLNLENLKSTT